jgi:hypothetical protein
VFHRPVDPQTNGKGIGWDEQAADGIEVRYLVGNQRSQGDIVLFLELVVEVRHEQFGEPLKKLL